MTTEAKVMLPDSLISNWWAWKIKLWLVCEGGWFHSTGSVSIVSPRKLQWLYSILHPVFLLGLDQPLLCALPIEFFICLSICQSVRIEFTSNKTRLIADQDVMIRVLRSQIYKYPGFISARLKWSAVHSNVNVFERLRLVLTRKLK